MSRRIFISCVTSEFQPLRKRLRSYLTAADCEVKSQEDFSQSDNDIIEKLDDYIRKCDAVIHIIGHETGSVAHEKPRREFLEDNADFLTAKPELLSLIGDCSDLTYTQWEVFLAIHHARRIRAYHFPGAQPEHRSRLKLGLGQRYSTEVDDESDIFGALIGDLREIVPDLPAHRISNIPASIGTLFKGRDDTLKELRESLKRAAHHTTAITAPRTIHGLGGIGKTRLAIEYGRRFADDYHALLLVRADSPENFRRNLAELTGPLVLDLPEYNLKDETSRIAAALRWLEAHPGWYLIIDNVDTEAAAIEVQAQIDRLTAGHVVITSRLSDWAGGVETLDLTVLDESDAVDFLMERTAPRRPSGATDEEDVGTLARQLDGLALALEQAGAYIAERRVTFRKYLDHWETRRAKVLGWHHEAKMRYPASVAITWQTSFDELGDEARQLLKILAEFAPDPIPRGIIEKGCDSGDLEDAFFELERYSLVRILEDPPDSFSIHRLVQEIAREFSDSGDQSPSNSSNHKSEESALPRETPNWLLAARLLRTWAPEVGWEFSTWDAWTVLAPHLELIFEKSEDARDPIPVPDLLDRFGMFRSARYGTDEEAEELIRRALLARTRELGEEHPETLLSLNNLALMLNYSGSFQESVKLGRKVFEARASVLGPEHSDTLMSMDNLASFLLSTGAYDESESVYRKVLENRKNVLGSEHPETLHSGVGLAMVLNERASNGEAEQIYRQTLNSRERILGGDHPDTLTSLNNLGMFLHDRGNHDEAEQLLRKVLAGWDLALGPDHPMTLTAVGNLASILDSKGANQEAKSLYRRGLNSRRRILGEEHPDTLLALNGWGIFLSSEGAHDEAVLLLLNALEVQERILGTEHPNTLLVTNNLGRLHQTKGDYNEAKKYHRRALDGRTVALGESHPDTILSMIDLADALESLEDYKPSEALYRKALELNQEIIGSDHPDTLQVQQTLAILLYDQGAYEEAESLFRALLKTHEKVLGPEHSNTLTTTNNLAMLLKARGAFKEAESLCRRMLEVEEQFLGPEHPDTLHSVNLLGVILHNSGDHSRAEPLVRRAFESRERVLGGQHADTLMSLRNLAVSLEEQENYAEAEPLYRRALEGRTLSLGSEHPDTLTSVKELAKFLKKRQADDEAVDLYRRAVTTQEKVLGEDHPD